MIDVDKLKAAGFGPASKDHGVQPHHYGAFDNEDAGYCNVALMSTDADGDRVTCMTSVSGLTFDQAFALQAFVRSVAKALHTRDGSEESVRAFGDALLLVATELAEIELGFVTEGV